MRWNKIDWLNIGERALWTFVEGFLVALPSAVSLGLDGAAWKAALFSALCAGLSALKTIVLEIIRIRLDILKENEEENQLLEELKKDEEQINELKQDVKEIPTVTPLYNDEKEKDGDASI